MPLPHQISNASRVTKVIFSLLMVGLLFNFACDFWAFQTFKETDISGEKVFRAGEIEPHLQKLDRAIADIELHPRDTAAVRTALIEAETLNSLIHNLGQRARLEKILQSLQSPKLMDISLIATRSKEMITNQATLLQKAVEDDRAGNQKLDQILSVTLAINILAILTLAVLFYFESLSRRKIEEDLTVANTNFQKLVRSLQTRLTDQFEKNKVLIHDLKNPLGTIQGFADLILDEGGSNPSIQEFSDAIRRSSEKTLRLVDSILLSPSVAETMDVSEQMDLVFLLKGIAKDYFIKAKIKAQTLKCEFESEMALVKADQTKLEELVGNLLGNAMKYSPAGSTIWLRCRSTQGLVRVEIEDQGQGFTRGDREKAFRLGQTLSAKTTGGESSTGYGLFIAKQIVDMHRGSIKIEDGKSGQGACVSFEIPALAKESKSSPRYN